MSEYRNKRMQRQVNVDGKKDLKTILICNLSYILHDSDSFNFNRKNWDRI